MLEILQKAGYWPGFAGSQGLCYISHLLWASLVAQMVKNPHAMQETWVQSLGWEDPLEKGMATQSSTLAWRIPWTEEPGGLQSMGSQEMDTVTNTFTSLGGEDDLERDLSSFGLPGSTWLIRTTGRCPLTLLLFLLNLFLLRLILQPSYLRKGNYFSVKGRSKYVYSPNWPQDSKFFFFLRYAPEKIQI